MVSSEHCRKSEAKGFRFSLVDFGKLTQGQEDGRVGLDLELCTNWAGKQDRESETQ